jgi:hypothetical protein
MLKTTSTVGSFTVERFDPPGGGEPTYVVKIDRLVVVLHEPLERARRMMSDLTGDAALAWAELQKLHLEAQ